MAAEHGGDGHDTKRGRHGEDYVLQVPIGTIVRERVWSGERTPEQRRIFLPQFRYQRLGIGVGLVTPSGSRGGSWRQRTAFACGFTMFQ